MDQDELARVMFIYLYPHSWITMLIRATGEESIEPQQRHGD
jgi:hypothetical protein